MKQINFLFFKFMLMLLPSVGMCQIDNGLIAFYSFDNGSSEEETGTINSNSNQLIFTQDRFGNETAAIDFQNETAYIDMGDNDFDYFSGENSIFSISFWVKNTASGNELVINKYGNSGCNPGEDQREFFIRMNENQKIEFLHYSTFVAENYRGVEGSTIITDDCWHHIVINYDGRIDTNDGLDRVMIYVDGNLENNSFSFRAGFLGDILNSTSHLGIGTSLDSEGQACSLPYKGKLDDIRFYNRNLNVQEVTELFLMPDQVSGESDFDNFCLDTIITDCNGLVNGTAILDSCGVCLEINDEDFNQSCITDTMNTGIDTMSTSAIGCVIYIPNVFSPNGDGLNDDFRLITKDCDVQVLSYRIFNRWGDEVYQAFDFSFQSGNLWWTGGQIGQNAPIGVYFYSIELRNLNNEIEFYSGDVTIIR